MLFSHGEAKKMKNVKTSELPNMESMTDSSMRNLLDNPALAEAPLFVNSSRMAEPYRPAILTFTLLIQP